MRCYECGYQNETDVKVCIKCGTKLEEGSAPAPTPPKPAQTSDAAIGGAKTMRGQVASSPSWDAPSQQKPAATEPTGNFSKCPSCQFYPLQAAPSPSNPCPNCGFGAAAQSSAKTVRVGEINLDGEDEAPKAFKLIDEKRGSELSFEGDQVNVNRDAVDPDNNNISSGEHAIFSFENGQLFIEDKSSNGSTFIKVEGKMAVNNGSKIVIGNRVFTLKID